MDGFDSDVSRETFVFDSLSNTESSKDLVKYIFHINTASKPTQCCGSQPEIFCAEFEVLTISRKKRREMLGGLIEVVAVPGVGWDSLPVGIKILLNYRREAFDKLGNAGAGFD